MIIGLLGLLGICLGSFVNALVWRLHQQEAKKSKNLSILKGRSMCPHCKHQLHAKDLVPIFSWLGLKGKCRYCKKPISAQYPTVELITGSLFALSYIVWPHDLSSMLDYTVLGLWLLIVVGFVAHTVYDIHWFTLLDKITLPLSILGVAFAATLAFAANDPKQLIGAALGAVVMFGLFYGLFAISDGKWLGGGDVKLAPLLGLLAGGLLESMLLLFVASTLGTVYSLIYAAVRKQKLKSGLRIPFGPFLIFATIFVVLWGEKIVRWYIDLLVIS